MRRKFVVTAVIAAGVIAGVYALSVSTQAQKSSGETSLVGAWKGHVQFKNGAYSSIKDLDFLYLFNEGGTMTESSNYDGAPPVPPAYGIWRKVGPKKYEAKYIFYSTQAPKTFEEVTKGGGWMPSGYGVLNEKITISDDGKSFKSSLMLDLFDANGKGVELADTATTEIKRIEF